ncbi:MAG TPA: diacylglycerol kinase family protein [Williamwhitmania sp.]|nr:diacylglycerol kinase family protein [Williamwhitmania sp.]
MVVKEKILFVVNPVSGTGKREKALKLIKEKLSPNYDAKIVITKFAGEATEIAIRYHQKGFNKVIAVGGDGTVNEVAKGVSGTNMAMGIIPTGSGNGLARHLHIPMNISKAIEVINRGNVTDIDHGTINDTMFFCTSGVGFDALIGNKFAEAGTRGLTTYAKTTIREYFTFKPQHYTLDIDGKIYERDSFMITFANASQYGNNAYIAPHADIADGLIDVVIVKRFPLYKSPRFAYQMFTKKMNRSPYVETFRAKNITLNRKEAGYVHFDGEPGTMGAMLKIAAVHAALKVIIP